MSLENESFTFFSFLAREVLPLLLHSGISLILGECTYDTYADFVLTNIPDMSLDLKDLFLLNKKKGGL